MSIPTRHKKLGEILLTSGLIDIKSLEEAISIQKKTKKSIGKILMEMGVVSETDIAKGLADQFNLPFYMPDELIIPKEIFALIPFEIAIQNVMVPLKREKDGLLVAIANPLQQHIVDDLRFRINMPIYLAVAPPKNIMLALTKGHPKVQSLRILDEQPQIEADKTDKPADLPSDGDMEIIRYEEFQEEQAHDLINLAGTPPVVQFTNSLFVRAIDMKASDIHIEPQKDMTIVRFRVDGIMHEIIKTKKNIHTSVVSRIKVISNIDISIQRKPQDGKAQVRYKEKTYDLRVSTLPSFYGEKVTIRILDPDMGKFTPEQLGFSERDYKMFLDAISKSEGIILVTGPTGSGKSSTLYSCLNKLNTPDINIVTVEDPVEFDIKGITQVSVNPKAGITFSNTLRSILRQDPDIIMVGEIRDNDTAAIAFRAAQTGHLVFSTLHTGDAPSAIVRLIDLGVQPFILSSSLIAIIGQRLVRKICPQCKAPDPLNDWAIQRISPYFRKLDKIAFWKGTGCPACQHTGYKGRSGIFEVLMMTPSIRAAIAPNVSSGAIKYEAKKVGFRSMAADGLKKAAEGITTIEEVLRVAPIESKDIWEPASEWNPAPVPINMPNSESITLHNDSMDDDDVIPATDSPKILVVEDNQLTLNMLTTLLQEENYTIFTAKNGETAMKIAVKENPDLILTDYVMPLMDGLSLIKQLKSHPQTSHIPIIMLTAQNNLKAEEEALYAGADDFLTKPIKHRRLLVRIKRLLDKSRSVVR